MFDDVIRIPLHVPFDQVEGIDLAKLSRMTRGLVEQHIEIDLGKPVEGDVEAISIGFSEEAATEDPLAMHLLDLATREPCTLVVITAPASEPIKLEGLLRRGEEENSIVVQRTMGTAE